MFFKTTKAKIAVQLICLTRTWLKTYQTEKNLLRLNLTKYKLLHTCF